MTKQIVKAFDRAVLTYDTSSSVQRKAGNYLISLLQNTLPDFQPSSVLDLGAGTGFISSLLHKSYPKARYTINDVSKSMLDESAKKFPSNAKVEFLHSNMEHTNFLPHDLIISNFAFQWCSDVLQLISNISKKSKVIAFSTLLDGTFDKWKSFFLDQGIEYKNHQYPSKDQLIKLIKSLNTHYYCFDATSYILPKKTPVEFIKYLKALGANTPKESLNLSDLKKAISIKEKIAVNYEVFFGLARF